MDGVGMKNIEYMKVALKEANKAYIKDEVPVGAVIVRNDEIISKGYNQKEISKNAIKHAELIAIDKACKKMNSWHLDDCILYTTLEPCLMCMGAILECRIKKIYYAISNEKYGSIKYLSDQQLSKMQIEKGICEKESLFLLQNFFQNKRN